MSSLDQLLENPEWRKNWNYAMGPPNGGFYKRWIQGSVGMMDPMNIYNNEYGFLTMKHGQNSIMPYRGNIKNFAPGVTPELRRQVVQCSRETINPVMCQQSAMSRVFTRNDMAAERSGGQAWNDTPHPFHASYHDGVPLGMPRIHPNDHRDD